MSVEDAAKAAARDAQKAELKDLIKSSLQEFVDENSEKQRTTGQPVEKPKSGSIFDALFGG